MTWNRHVLIVVGTTWAIACGDGASPPVAGRGQVTDDAGTSDASTKEPESHDRVDGGRRSIPDAGPHDSGTDTNHPGLDAETARHDATMDEDTGAATSDAGMENDASNVPNAGFNNNCVIDPSKIYAVGTLEAGGSGAIAITSLEASPQVCLAFADRYETPTLKNGHLIYLDWRNDVFRQLVADALIWDASNKLWNVPQAAANDTLVSGSCPFGSYPGAPYAAPDGNQFAWSCIESGSSKSQIYWSHLGKVGPTEYSIKAAGKNGLLFVRHNAGAYEDALMDAAGKVIPIESGPSFAIAVRAHEDGFRIEGYHDLWEIAADGKVQKLGNYSDYPADVGTSTSSGVLDQEGRVYEPAELKDGTQVVLRRSLEPGVTEIVYSDANAPQGGSDLTVTPPVIYVHLDGANLFTGP